MEILENNQTELETLSKKERKILKRQRKEQEYLKRERQRKLKRFLLIAGAVLALGLVILVLVWFSVTKPPVLSEEIIAKQGIHSHINLTVKILGRYQTIPDNLGRGISMKSIHTHDNNGVIHLEFSGLVKQDDLRLSQFFKVWGKQFSEQCIFDKCNGSDGQLKMLVNNELNFEFARYVMKDNDDIEIIFD